jgi:hypothetical protein
MCNFLNGVVVRVDSDTGSSSDKTANDIFFDSTIDESDFQIRVARVDMERVFCADLFDKVDFSGIEECFVFVCIVFFANNDSSKTRSAFSEKSDDGTGIDSGNSRDTRTGTPGRKRLDGCPVRVFGCVVGDNDACALDSGGFKVSEEIVFITCVYRGDTIVSEERLSEDEDLAFVGWVGHGFGIANNGCREDCFTADVTVGTK